MSLISKKVKTKGLLQLSGDRRTTTTRTGDTGGRTSVGPHPTPGPPGTVTGHTPAPSSGVKGVTGGPTRDLHRRTRAVQDPGADHQSESCSGSPHETGGPFCHTEDPRGGPSETWSDVSYGWTVSDRTGEYLYRRGPGPREGALGSARAPGDLTSATPTPPGGPRTVEQYFSRPRPTRVTDVLPTPKPSRRGSPEPVGGHPG